MVDIVKNKKEQETVTFYIYTQNDVLYTHDKKIYSPFNEGTFNPRDPAHDVYRDPVIFEFKGGVYETSDPQSIEALDAWSTYGKKRLSNGKMFGPDNVNKIKRDKPVVSKATNTIVEKVVEIQVLPEIVVNGMTVAQLQQVVQSWGIELPKDVVSGENVKERIINALREGGHIQG